MFFGMNGYNGCNKGCDNHDRPQHKGFGGCGCDTCTLLLVLLMCGCNGFGEDNCCWNIILLILLLQCICK